jgi:hypothetical protein
MRKRHPNLCSFVVEKDGKLTDIQVKNDPSYVLEEAIRAEIFKNKMDSRKNQLKASTNFLQIAHHITNYFSIIKQNREILLY